MNFHSFDQDYVTRLAHGDRTVEEHFSSYFSELLYLKLRSRLRSPQLIEDIRQETLMRVLKTLKTKGGIEYPERFGAFVNSVCNNVMMELLRSDTRYDQIDPVAVEPADTGVDLDAPLVDRERKRDIQKVLDDLPQKDREILKMLYLDERDREDVCRHFKVDDNYLRVLVHRAKSRFRNALARSAGKR